MHQRLIGKGPDAQRRSELGAVGQRHLLFGVKGVEAVAGPSAFAGPALAAHGTPVQDHEVAGLDCGYTRPDGLDDARGLVSEQKRVFVVDAALAVGQVGMAYPQAVTSTTASPGPGSGTTMFTSSTGSPFCRAITPRTV